MSIRKFTAKTERREHHVAALGIALNALVSQSRVLTAEAATVFHAELQPAAFHIAVWLSVFGPAKSSAVAEAVGMDRSAASRLIRELGRLELIKACEDPLDRRSAVLSLSAEGQKRLQAAMRSKATVFNQRIASWSDEDLALCANLLGRLVDPQESSTASA